MKNFRKLAAKAALQRIKERAEQGPETHINVFNSGFVLDLKKVKIIALEIAEKINENIK